MKKILIALFITVTAAASVFGATSNDVYLRQDVFEAKMDAFMAEIRLMNEQTRSELNEKIQATNSRIDATNSRIDVTNARIDATNTRLEDLFHMIYWGIGLLGLLITLAAVSPYLVKVIKSVPQPKITLDENVEQLIKKLIASELQNRSALS